MRSYHNFEVKPINMICNINVKPNLSLNALPPGDSNYKDSHHLSHLEKAFFGDNCGNSKRNE